MSGLLVNPYRFTTGGGGGGGTITHGDQINATNTGFTALYSASLGRNLVAADLTPHAGGTISTNGVLYYARDFTSQVTVTGNNNVFAGCRHKTNGGDATSRAFANQGTGNTFSYCTIVPNSGFGYGFGILNESGSVDIWRCDITRAANLISLYAGPAHIWESYLHDAGNVTDGADHVDGIELYGGNGHRIELCRIDVHLKQGAADWAVSPFNIAPWGGGSCNVIEIWDNFIDGGVNGHIMTDSQTTPMDSVKNVRVARNKMGGHTFLSGLFPNYTPYIDFDGGRAIVSTLAAQVADPLAVYWPTSGVDASYWAETQTAPALSPNNNGVVVTP